MNSVLQYVLYVGILVAFSIPLGFYMSKVMDGEKTIVSRALRPVERGIYKLLRIDPEEDMGWKKYLAAALLFNLFGFMKQTALRAFGLVLVMTVLCGFLYTMVCTGINQTLFPHQANGSVIEIDGKTYGSELLAQQFTKPEHLWGRPMSLDLTSFTDEEGNENA